MSYHAYQGVWQHTQHGWLPKTHRLIGRIQHTYRRLALPRRRAQHQRVARLDIDGIVSSRTMGASYDMEFTLNAHLRLHCAIQQMKYDYDNITMITCGKMGANCRVRIVSESYLEKRSELSTLRTESFSLDDIEIAKSTKLSRSTESKLSLLVHRHHIAYYRRHRRSCCS